MSTEARITGVTRRAFLERTGTATVAATTIGFPFIRNAAAAELELRWLGWEHYNVKELTAAFEQEHGVKVSAGFFDGNSEAYNKLRAGGTQDFDLVMADGFWPRLYAKQGLTQPVDYGQLGNLTHVFPRLPAAQLHAAAGRGRLGDDRGAELLGRLRLHRQYRRGRRGGPGERSASCSTRSTRATSRPAPASRRTSRSPASSPPHEMGTIDAERPDGKPFNPYVLTDEELARCKELLIKQKGLLVTRWNDEDTLERLLRAGVVWASPEWSGIYRRIHFDKLDGKTDLNMRHVLKPTRRRARLGRHLVHHLRRHRQREAGGGAQMDRLPPARGEHGHGRDRDRLGADASTCAT